MNSIKRNLNSIATNLYKIKDGQIIKFIWPSLWAVLLTVILVKIVTTKSNSMYMLDAKTGHISITVDGDMLGMIDEINIDGINKKCGGSGVMEFGAAYVTVAKQNNRHYIDFNINDGFGKLNCGKKVYKYKRAFFLAKKNKIYNFNGSFSVGRLASGLVNNKNILINGKITSEYRFHFFSGLGNFDLLKDFEKIKEFQVPIINSYDVMSGDVINFIDAKERGAKVNGWMEVDDDSINVSLRGSAYAAAIIRHGLGSPMIINLHPSIVDLVKNNVIIGIIVVVFLWVFKLK